MLSIRERMRVARGATAKEVCVRVCVCVLVSFVCVRARA